MIEEYFFFPGSFVVAAPAFLSFLAFMDIILFVTTEARGFEILVIEGTFVTSCTFRLHVFTPQREFCITVVVEDDAFPIPFRVAVTTFGAKAPLVAFLIIVHLMTRVTVRLKFFLIEPSLMAGCAFGKSVFATQRKVSAPIVVKK